MRSRTVHLPAGPCPPEVLRAAAAADGQPDLALAFLPPDEHLTANLAVMAALWPGSLRLGCEALSQFAGGTLTTRGTLQLFWWDGPQHGAAVDVIEGSHAAPPPPERAAALARRLAASDGALLLVDGWRFPAESFLAEVRRNLAAGEGAARGRPLSRGDSTGQAAPDPRVAGGLASQEGNADGPGAHVFFQERMLPTACLALLFHGVDVRIEVVRGWDPASPIYTVGRAAGNVIFEIDGSSATDWYRRFFTTADGDLAPMPESAFRFPLIVEGPGPERQGLYRSMNCFDQPPGAVSFWGSVESGDRVRLGMGNDVSLVRTAAELQLGPPPEAAILYSCVCRQRVLGEAADREVATIHRALGEAALSGFCTSAEIGPTRRGSLALYNHTAILVLLSEKRAAA
jgi:hypothetical protein